MNLSTQLRIILLLVGAAIWLTLYLLGRRRARNVNAPTLAPEAAEPAATFDEVPALDEDELETPAYMRRRGMSEPRQDYEPRIATASDYVDDIAVHDDEQYLDDAAYSSHAETQRVNQFDAPAASHRSGYAEPVFAEPLYVEPRSATAAHEEHQDDPNPSDVPANVSARREPVVQLDDELAEPSASTEPPTLPNIPVMAEPVAQQNYIRPEPAMRPAQTPTLSMAVPQPSASGSTREPRATHTNPAARRKIIALRLPMPERVAGEQLLALLQGERLEHGKFNIFHRMHEAGTVFSVASMVEPGSFDVATMPGQMFPGITLFMLLPGPLDGLVAYDQMMSCAQRLAHATGGLLHDERGNKLTASAMERLREEVLDFQHLIGGS